MRRLLSTAALLFAVLASTANAADITVTVGPGRTFNPNGATRNIDPDDTVTWQYAGGSEDHHVASTSPAGTENWNFGETNSGTFTHDFAKSGNFTFVCLLHDEMTGTIAVSGSPVPSFTKTATEVFAEDGTQVDFNSTSTDPDGTINATSWDLNGDGTFGDSTDAAPQDVVYATPGTVNVRLRITDNRNNVRETAQAITVRSRMPAITSLNAPATALQNANVTFNAVATDADGTIANYSWDLENDGTFETDTGTTASLTTAFATVGAKTVGLQVTDDLGNTTTATRAITINAPPPPPPGGGSTPPPPPPSGGSTPPPPPPPATNNTAPPAVLAPVTVTPPASKAPVAQAAVKPLALTASGPRGQRLARQRGVKVKIACDGACQVVGTGTLRAGKKRLRLKRAVTLLKKAGSTTLTLKLSAKDMKRAKGALKASVTITATDAAGRVVVRRVSVSLRR